MAGYLHGSPATAAGLIFANVRQEEEDEGASQSEEEEGSTLIFIQAANNRRVPLGSYVLSAPHQRLAVIF